MSPDTPLPEVAKMLPVAAAQLLTDQPAEVQALTVDLLKHQMVFWERQGVVLDPVQFETIVTSLVVTTIHVYVHTLRGAHGTSGHADTPR